MSGLLLAQEGDDSAASLPATRDILAKKRWLLLPIRNKGKLSRLEILAGGKVVRSLVTELAKENPDWWAAVDISLWKDETLTLRTNGSQEDCAALRAVRQSDEWDKPGEIYNEPLRPLLHFTAKRGWLNDPNGLVHYNGEYHVFYQHCPHATQFASMHWGHAVSRDLVHWTDLGVALYPDDLGQIYSGSGIVDAKNTSGLGSGGKAPMVLFYSAVGGPEPASQCLAYSLDGRTFTKYDRNPVLPGIVPGNRDPKVFWHEPSGKWVMVLYAGTPVPGEKDENGKPLHRTAVHILTSPNLREWTPASVVEGGADKDRFLFECPDLFPLRLDGDAGKVKWVLTAANGMYSVGAFDGTTFTPETGRVTLCGKIKSYAGQTFSNIPGGRVIQLGWLFTSFPGMPFNQCLSIPRELTLRTTSDGPRLFVMPVEEIKTLRGGAKKILPPFELKPGVNALAGVNWPAADIECVFTPGADSRVELAIHGAKVVYDAASGTLDGEPCPLVDGAVRLRVLVDRQVAEIYGAEGRIYLPVTYTTKPGNEPLSLRVKGSPVRINTLECHEMTSIWKPEASM